MTAVMDFSAQPPEFHSARMYSGAGAAPMLAAASAWNGLSAELRATALAYSSVLMALISEEWHGLASAAMTAAATPYVTWMSTTAVRAEHAAQQAEAAAAAYELAFAAVVPPPLIAANRAQLRILLAANILGQNAPVIAATEAQYTEMWAQDAGAMYDYARASAAASQLLPFTEPQQTTNAAGLAAQSATVTEASGTAAGSQQSVLSELMAAIPGALQGLASPSQQTGLLGSLLANGIPPWLKDLWDNWGPNSNFWNTIASTGFLLPSNMITPFLGLVGGGTADAAADVADAAVDAGAGVASAAAAPLESAGGLGGLIAAGAGNAPIIGKLAVPPSWVANAPLPNPLGSALGGTPMVAPPPAMAAGMPGMPVGAMGSQGLGRAVPQYGFRPTFVARPPAAG